MLKFSVGNRWDFRFLEQIAAINNKYSNTGNIAELYGSLHSSVTGIRSARPDFRLPNVSFEFLKEYVDKAHFYGIKINYTINAPFCEHINEVANKKKDLQESILKLVDSGIDIFTVADSLLLEIITECTELPVELSSVLHVASTAQIPIYNKWGGITDLYGRYKKSRHLFS